MSKVPAVVAADPDLTITDADFERFREYFYRRTGIQFDPAKRYFVDKRLQERIIETRSGNFQQWYSLLRFDPKSNEMQVLTNLMTVNETYFFREDYQFDGLVRSLLPEIIRRKPLREPIRIWCVPSSSGEEPYSVAITLMETWPQLEQWDVEILASDIDTDILNRARRGLYEPRSLMHVPAAWKQKYFTPVGDRYQLAASVREVVDFSRVNLTHAQDTRGFRNIDVVFCRNLLIYFDDVSRKVAAGALYEALAPGGFVCLGHSESMSRISPLFTVRKFPEAIVYQKPLEAR